jgi:elongation factor Ts
VTTITVDQVRALRERTGAGVLDAKKALESTQGDMDQAITLLREKGLSAAAKKAGREAKDGLVLSYLHGSPARIGVLLELNCETDFVARTPQFQQLAQNLAMQIAAANPRFLREEDVPEAELASERQIVERQLEEQGKPAAVREKIMAGKLGKWLDEIVLVRQPYIRDEDVRVGQLVTDAIAELGENIVIRRFARFELGEGA